MALKNKTQNIERASRVQRAPQRTVRTSNEHEQPSPQVVDLQRAMTLQSSALRPRDVLALQRTVGNRAAQQILAGKARRSSIQAKLAVGPANDHYEREADRVAATVMQTSERSVPQIQRQGLEEEDQTIQTKPLVSSITPLIQRQETPEEEENPVQLRSDGGQPSVASGAEHVIERARGGGQPLPDGLLARMERSFGADFSAVRVHADSESDSLNRSLHARAFTTGQDLFFRRGEYNPESRRGQELIAHELTHVVQQNGGKSGKKNLSLKRSTSTVIQRGVLDYLKRLVGYADEQRGEFKVDVKGEYGNLENKEGEKYRRQNYNEDLAPDVANYSLLALGGGFGAGKVIAERSQAAVEAAKGTKTEAWFFGTPQPLTDATTTLSSLGAVSAGLGTITAGVDAYKGFKEWRNTDNPKAQRELALGSGLSGLGNVAQQSATTAFHIANAAKNPAAAATAEAVTGGAALLTGAVDMARGFYAISKARQNLARLKDVQDAELARAAKQAQSTLEMRKSTGKWTVAKGALTALGGGMLLASAATPIGWLLIGVGALVGLAGTIKKYLDKKKRAKAIAMTVYKVSQADMDAWEKRVDEKKAATRWGSDERKKQLAELGPSPLDKKLETDGFVSIGHFYANYINKTANDLYTTGIAARKDLEAEISSKVRSKYREEFLQRSKRMPFRQIWLELPKFSRSKSNISLSHVYGQITSLLASIGLKADFGNTPPEPKPEKIGKALHD